MPRVRNQPGRYSETTSLQKKKKVIQAWWQVLVVLAPQQAEAGGLIESGRLRLQCAD